MAWTIELDPAASKELARFDPTVVRRILRFLDQRLAQLEDPRSIGEALKGPKFGEFWKYRVGDYRIIARIEDNKVLILVLKVGNRRDVYR
jgi:mRNA interferase RelE/StbE